MHILNTTFFAFRNKKHLRTLAQRQRIKNIGECTTEGNRCIPHTYHLTLVLLSICEIRCLETYSKLDFCLHGGLETYNIITLRLHPPK